MSDCSRCQSPYPNRGCHVCGESEHRTENQMITIKQLYALRDEIRKDLTTVKDIIDRAENGDIGPDEAERELAEAEINLSERLP